MKDNDMAYPCLLNFYNMLDLPSDQLIYLLLSESIMNTHSYIDACLCLKEERNCKDVLLLKNLIHMWLIFSHTDVLQSFLIKWAKHITY